MGFGFWVLGFGFWVLGFGFWVWGLGFGVGGLAVGGLGLGFGGWGLRVGGCGVGSFWISEVQAKAGCRGPEEAGGLGDFGVARHPPHSLPGFEFRSSGFGFQVSDFRFRVSNFGFRLERRPEGGSGLEGVVARHARPCQRCCRQHLSI